MLEAAIIAVFFLGLGTAIWLVLRLARRLFGWLGRVGRAPAAERGRKALPGVTVEIDYVDAEGEPSRREITPTALVTGDRPPIVEAYCHLRKEPRSFRIDRIRRVVDGDGVIHEAATFFSGLTPDGGAVPAWTGRNPGLAANGKSPRARR